MAHQTVKKDRRKQNISGMIMKPMYFLTDDIVFMESLKNEGVIEDRSKFMRACVAFTRHSKENLKQVLAYAEKVGD